MTTCPSGVDYRRLVDHTRVKIEETYRRPLADRLLRSLLVRLIPSRAAFRAAITLAAAGRLLKPAMSRLPGIGGRTSSQAITWNAIVCHIRRQIWSSALTTRAPR